MKHALTLLTALLLALTFVAAQADEPKLYGDPEKAREAWTLIEDGALVIDVRSDEEVAEGTLEGALHIPHTQIEDMIAAIGEDRTRTVVLYCRSGGRAGRALDALEAEGYESVFNATGYDALVATRP